jgi:probable HAF family extracellular repeat protein
MPAGTFISYFRNAVRSRTVSRLSYQTIPISDSEKKRGAPLERVLFDRNPFGANRSPAIIEKKMGGEPCGLSSKVSPGGARSAPAGEFPRNRRRSGKLDFSQLGGRSMKRFHSRKQSLRLETLEDRQLLSAYLEILEPFGGPGSRAYAVGDYGPAIGAADVSASNYNAAMWTPGMGPDINLGTLGGANSVATAINHRGTVVGWSHDAKDVLTKVAFQWNKDTGMQSLGFDGVAYDINDAGTVVGQNSSGQALVMTQGSIQLIAASAKVSQATAISESGMVVGFAEHASLPDPSAPKTSAFAWADGKLTDLGALRGDNRSEAYAVNSASQVVGQSGYQVCDSRGCDYMSSRAFIWQAGLGMRDIGSLSGSGDTAAYAINSAGYVVGESDGRAFMYTQGQMFDLNDIARFSGWTLTAATGINDQGWIVGQATNQCVTRAFLLVPDGLIVVDPGVGDLPLAQKEPESSGIKSLPPLGGQQGSANQVCPKPIAQTIKEPVTLVTHKLTNAKPETPFNDGSSLKLVSHEFTANQVADPQSDGKDPKLAAHKLTGNASSYSFDDGKTPKLVAHELIGSSVGGTFADSDDPQVAARDLVLADWAEIFSDKKRDAAKLKGQPF